MGVQREGAFGGFVNKTGPLVGRYLKGQNVITGLPHPSQKPPTQGQIDARLKFRTIVSWLSWISALIRVGWKEHHKEKETPMNAAVSYHYAKALTGTSPNFSIDYTKVVFSRGKLSPVSSAEVSTSEPMEVKFSWSASVSTGFGGATDLATVLIYSPDRQNFVYLSGAAPRSALSYDLAVPVEFVDELVHCWICFASVDGKMVSNSTYIGAVTVVA